MKTFLTSQIAQLRLLGLLEGISLVLLVLLAVPAKHIYGEPLLVQVLGPVHGVLFLLFIFYTFRVSAGQKWSFADTWKILLSSFIPFGTFYVDRKILSRMQADYTAQMG